MTTKKIFVINGVVEHEFCKPVKALWTSHKANDFLEKAEQYHKQRPVSCDYENIDNYFTKIIEWLSSHPCGNEANDFDYFEIVEVELI